MTMKFKLYQAQSVVATGINNSNQRMEIATTPNETPSQACTLKRPFLELNDGQLESASKKKKKSLRPTGAESSSFTAQKARKSRKSEAGYSTSNPEPGLLLSKQEIQRRRRRRKERKAERKKEKAKREKEKAERKKRKGGTVNSLQPVSPDPDMRHVDIIPKNLDGKEREKPGSLEILAQMATISPRGESQDANTRVEPPRREEPTMRNRAYHSEISAISQPTGLDIDRRIALDSDMQTEFMKKSKQRSDQTSFHLQSKPARAKNRKLRSAVKIVDSSAEEDEVENEPGEESHASSKRPNVGLSNSSKTPGVRRASPTNDLSEGDNSEIQKSASIPKQFSAEEDERLHHIVAKYKQVSQNGVI
jgi:hypothetical protein